MKEDNVNNLHKGNQRRILILSVATIVIATIMVIWGKFFMESGDEMGYSLLNFYIIFPVVAFVCSLHAGLKQMKDHLILPLVYGILSVTMPLLVFGAYDWIGVWLGFVPSALGVFIGRMASKVRRNK